MLDEQTKDRVLRAIDRGEWKHSWHLPKDRGGYVDWWRRETLEECIDILYCYRSDSLKFAYECDLLADSIAKALKESASEDE